ncbi:MAG: serine/threonine-protein kinase [Planctomycetota bacterium]|nr:serine/threonine-protein kinase [Planctomycetota bacterium]MDA1212246.1 serine/threonine-protein kinase [Planctomycetota bacterium]
MAAEIHVSLRDVDSPVGESGTSDNFSAETSSKILDSERYRLSRMLGTGGFGSVYAARDLVLERAVAVKIPKLDRKDAIESFLNEMRSAAKLRHPHIITIYDSGIDKQGRPFAVFELVEGRTLSDLAREGALDRITTVRLIAEAAEAVHYSHRHSLVHRDIKPSNILVNSEKVALIADFGLAVNDSTQRELSGDIAGSPAYMSPEQVRGETHRMDGRTDIWSLGVILYELLTGKRPFKGKNQQEVFDEILNREPKPPRQLIDSLPKELEDCILKCLEKSVKDRYTTAADLAVDLRKWLISNSDSALNYAIVNERDIGKSTIQIRDSVTKGNKPKLQGRSRSIVTTFIMVAGVGFLASAIAYLPTRTSTTPVPPVPAIGQDDWQPLLIAMPKLLTPANVSDFSTVNFDAFRRTLSITTDQIAAFSLGEVKDPSYRIRIDISQVPWTEGAGVFIGYQLKPNAAGDQQKYHCQVIEFIKNPSALRQPFIARSYLTFNAAGRIFERHTVAEEVTKVTGNSRNQLELNIANGKLLEVSLNGDVYRELTSPESEQSFAQTHNTQGNITNGQMGVLAQNGAFRFENATWFTTKGKE